MRAPVIVCLLALGCGKSDPREGRLICKTNGKTYEARVAPGMLSTVRARADQAQLTDCRFVAGTPTIERWPIESVALTPPPPLPPDLDLGGGVVGGVLGAPPPPPPPPAPPINVPPSVLENNRIAGVKQIEPDPDSQLEIQRSGKDKVIGSFKMCITADGEVSSVSQLKSTGFATYDSKIIRLLKTWKYMPYIYNGAAAPVCTAVTFIYSTT